MGDYQKKAYQERDLIKALAKINGFCDEKTEKLSDKLKNVELSHKRKYKLILECEKRLKILLKTEPLSGFAKELITDLLLKCNQELTFIGRVKGIF